MSGFAGRLVFAFIGLFLASASWAMATPIGGVPDEPAHIVRAASVARGEVFGVSTDQAAVTRVAVPASIAALANEPCYAHKPQQTADCAAGSVTSSDSSTATTSAGLYNPLYYGLVGWASLPFADGHMAVYAMRILSGAMASALLALAYGLFKARAPGRTMDVAFAAAATPMVLFLHGSVNPNALEIAAGAAFLGSLLALGPLGRSAGTRVPLATAAAAGVILANARGLGPMWLGMLTVAAALSIGWPSLRDLAQRRSAWAAAGVLGLGSAFSLFWIMMSRTLSAMGSFPGSGTSPFRALVVMLTGTPDPGLVGRFGWLDHLAPASAFALWSALALGAVGLAVALARGRQLAALAVLLGGVILVPPIVQAATISSSGYIWQGRYTLVAYVAAVLFAGSVAAASRPFRLGGRARVRLGIAIVMAVALAQGYTLLVSVKRYAVGHSADWATFLVDAVWSPPGGPWVWAALCAGGIALTLWGGGELAARQRGQAPRP